MKFTHEQCFDASVDRVMAMYNSPHYLSKKYELLGLREIRCLSSDFRVDGFSASYSFLQQNKVSVPALAKKFMGSSDWLATRQTDQWQTATRSGQLEIVLESFKSVISIRCAMRLEARGTGCVNHMAWEVDCSIPLVGGKLAAFIADDINVKSAEDSAVAQQLLLSNDYLAGALA